MQPVIIHHANCPDGFGAAFLTHRSLSAGGDDPIVIAASYGDPLPEEIDGAEVFVVDFCYPTEQLIELRERSAWSMILDHHKTAIDYVDGSGYNVYPTVGQWQPLTHTAVIDMDHSGIGLASMMFDETAPFVSFLQDRDLWKFQLWDTPHVFAAMTSYPYDMDVWSDLSYRSIGDLVAEGKAIERYRQQLIEQAVDNARLALIPTGHRVWVTACPYAIGSDVAGELAKRTPDTFAAYYVDHEETIRFGLRSTEEGMDVAEVASALGGGGHRRAAGFEVNRKWNGWT